MQPFSSESLLLHDKGLETVNGVIIICKHILLGSPRVFFA